MKDCQASPAPGTRPAATTSCLQGTSMASPHAAGVAALAISAHGQLDRVPGSGWTPTPYAACCSATATNHTCPSRRRWTTSTRAGRPFTATCVGTAPRNGFYGEGIVNAWGVVR